MLKYKLSESRSMAKDVKLMFVTDIHGSEVVFRKALNASKIYGVDYLVFGGDLVAKRVVPVVEKEGKYFYGGKEVDLEELVEEGRRTGYYVFAGDEREVEELLEKPEVQEKVYAQFTAQQVVKWLDIAQEKLKGTKIKLIWSVGNDDPLYLDKVFAERGIKVEGIEEIGESSNSLQLVSYGYVNETPFHTYREKTETEIYLKGEEYLSRLDPSRVILNFHAPPYNTRLDQALIDGRRVHVGSRAVRDLMDKYKPLLGLHGHIHESWAEDKVGKTLVVNPGSQAYEGILRYSIVTIERELKGIVLNYKVKSIVILTG